MFKFSRNYFLSFLLLLIIEMIIAAFIRDRYIRPFLGDVLVVILLYCLVKSFFRLPVLPAVMAVLCFSFLLEFMQYVSLISFLELENGNVGSIILGSSFSAIDLYMYTAGAIIVIMVERGKGFYSR